MLNSKPTPQMIQEWKSIFHKYHSKLIPNRKSGKELENYLINHYKADKYNCTDFAKVVEYNILENEYSIEKLPLDTMPDIVVYKIRNYDIIIGIDRVTAYIHIESEDIDAINKIYDDLFVYRGLDETDINNYFLVAQYIQAINSI